MCVRWQSEWAVHEQIRQGGVSGELERESGGRSMFSCGQVGAEEVCFDVCSVPGDEAMLVLWLSWSVVRLSCIAALRDPFDCSRWLSIGGSSGVM